MSEDQTDTPVPLPPPLRLLTEQEDIHVGNALIEKAQEYSVDRFVAQQLVYTALGALGLFPLPGAMDPPGEHCSALKLAWDTTKHPDSEYLGQWVRCSEAAGHGSTDHHASGVADWSDGEPGTVPDTRTA
ncbi:hypothetical protein ABT120_45715 [Nonomuraea angiospora]|uniref:hypothetical protein n=1 Tax=Nonomuraea angiospora TaxID=46172 RepID=UPI0033204C8B